MCVGLIGTKERRADHEGLGDMHGVYEISFVNYVMFRFFSSLTSRLKCP